MLEQITAARKDPVAFMTENGFDFTGLPESLRPGYAYWWCFGTPAGSFMQAAIENKFIAAVVKADDVNISRLRDIAVWLWNNGDNRAVGKNADTWAFGGGYFGRLAKAEKGGT